MLPIITIAILAKDKAHVLPFYLKLIHDLDYPKKKINLYIRTNNNNDDTERILRTWVLHNQGKYNETHFNAGQVHEQVQEYKPHEWNAVRFKVLGKIRQESVDWARSKGSGYFVVDCDNFIVPETLMNLVLTGLPAVAPMLTRCDAPTYYSNYHYDVDDQGYYIDSQTYCDVFDRKIVGLIKVPVIHCTYYLRPDVLSKVKYVDDTERYEYAIFSDWLRKSNVPQYIDNRQVYGKMTFADTAEEFAKLRVTEMSIRA